MRPKSVTVSSHTTSQPVPVNWRGVKEFNMGLFVALSSGAVMTYSVEYSPDNPEDFTSEADYNANGQWMATTDLDSLSADAQGAIQFPVRAVRLNVSAHTSGDATLKIIQSE